MASTIQLCEMIKESLLSLANGGGPMEQEFFALVQMATVSLSPSFIPIGNKVFQLVPLTIA